VAALVRQLGGEATGTALGPLLALRPTRDETPLFCAAPLTGLSWCYSRLAPFIARDRAIYGLQAHAITAGGTLPASLAEMAARHVADIRRLQPTGPYHLLGWSFGGVLAFEIASRLQGSGDAIGLLAMLDAYPSDGLPRDVPTGDALDRDVYLRQVLDSGEIDDELAERIRRLAAHSVQLAARHRQGRLRGPVLLFSAARNADAARTGSARWAPHVEGPIDERRIDCGHFEMLDREPLSRICDVLNARLTGDGERD
jgi:thioesterase domain-containing protein